jgi:serine/threonine protein kinase
MYQGLTGHLPFEHLIPPIDLPGGLYSEWLYNEKSKLIPIPPSVYNNSVPKKLDALVLRCLEFNPAKRYMHAGALLKALDDLTKPESDGKSCLDMARGLVAEGNMKGACDYFESCLESPDIPKETHFTLLREWGEALMTMGDNKQAAVKLVAAWDIAKDSGAILRTRSERVQFLEEIEKTFAKSGNVWQANRFKGYKEDQLRARVI